MDRFQKGDYVKILFDNLPKAGRVGIIISESTWFSESYFVRSLTPFGGSVTLNYHQNSLQLYCREIRLRVTVV